MKVKVLAKFRDKTANLQVREKDQILEVEKDRGENLIRIGFAEEVPEKEKKNVKNAAE